MLNVFLSLYCSSYSFCWNINFSISIKSKSSYFLSADGDLKGRLGSGLDSRSSERGAYALMKGFARSVRVSEPKTSLANESTLMTFFLMIATAGGMLQPASKISMMSSKSDWIFFAPFRKEVRRFCSYSVNIL